MDANTLRNRFSKEQENIQRYVDYMQYRVTFFGSELRDILGAIPRNDKYIKKHFEDRLDAISKNTFDKNDPVEQLRKTYELLEDLHPYLSEEVKSLKMKLNAVDEPDGISSVDVRSELGEIIQFLIDYFENETSLNAEVSARREISEQLEMSKQEMGEEYYTEIDSEALDYAIQSAKFIIDKRAYENLLYLINKHEELAIAQKLLDPMSEICVYRQAFILLMTVFDATVFDLMRVAFRKNFFGFIGLFGKQEKLNLDSLSNFTSFEDFRDAVIEEQLKSKYLKEILSMLHSKEVQLINPSSGLSFAHIREMVQRRNIHVHNRGIVDDNYMGMDDRGAARHNIYNLPLGSLAEIDRKYWERVNEICTNCIINISDWIEKH